MRRVDKNHEITTAKANVYSRNATQVLEKARFRLDRLHSVQRHYKDDMEAIDDSFKR